MQECKKGSVLRANEEPGKELSVNCVLGEYQNSMRDCEEAEKDLIECSFPRILILPTCILACAFTHNSVHIGRWCQQAHVCAAWRTKRVSY